MKYKLIDVCGEQWVMVYVIHEERETPEVINSIEDLKKQYKHVAIFTGGTMPIKPAIKKIIEMYADKERY